VEILRLTLQVGVVDAPMLLKAHCHNSSLTREQPNSEPLLLLLLLLSGSDMVFANAS
jgi:hypothetical protein